MSVSGITGATSKVQIPIAIKEKTPTEEMSESQVQKAAEQLKANTAKILPHSQNGVGQSVNLKA
jgi:hypothetical protein